MTAKRASRAKSGNPNRLGKATAYKPDYCALVIEHCEKGGSIGSFGGVVGVVKTTVQNWRAQNPDFAEACEIGIMKSAIIDEYALATLARSGQGSVIGLTYRLGNRLPDEWRTVSRTELSGPNGGPVETVSKVELVAG